MDAEEYIDIFKSDCERLSGDIIYHLCKRVIKRMNKEMKSVNLFTDDYPAEFNYIDKLSIELETYSYVDIDPSGLLEDYIYDSLENEFNRLPKTEKLIVEYSFEYDHYEYDINVIIKGIHKEFREMLDNHYSLKKIQEHPHRWW